ncbi:artemin [Pseudophryne corroboree]|uniref:artemin n=1 Tax=Pseudophryne corroboree TaxID=495146 RepID=UPI003081E482
MLSFGHGDLTVTSHHWWRNRIQICNPLPGRLSDDGKVAWGGTVKTSEDRCPEWSLAGKTSASVGTKRAGNCSQVWNRNRTLRKKSPREQHCNRRSDHDRPELFMGRGSRPVTTPPWSCKVTLWPLLLSLLLSAMITSGSPTPVIGGPSDTETDSDTSVTSDPSSIDFVVEENLDITIKSTWSTTYENITSEGRSEDELQDNILFRAERSPETLVKPKKNRKSGSRGNGKKGEKGCSKQSLRVKVRDLGLGYDSDEWITFYYCSGTCQQSRSNYDVTLTTLLNNKNITHSSHGRVSNHPCCRPTSYLPVSFMDVKNNWKVVDKLSAADCSCVR